MIAWQLIGAAAFFTATAVAGAAYWSHWPPLETAVAALLSSALIIGWRAVSNLYGLNEDFGPLISVGDVGCLVAGGLAPAMVALRGERPLRWLPAIVGGVTGFVVNVVIL